MRARSLRAWRRMALGVGLAVAAALVAAVQVPLPERLSLEPSSVVRYRDGTVGHVFLSPDDRWRIATTVGRVDPAYVDALIAFEDGRFWWHPGVDGIAVARATLQNLGAGRVVSGASTLTMQLIRLAEPRPRTLSSKAVEALQALQVELHLSKEEILEAYLQLAPYGRNVEGVEAASWAYFGHSADALTAAEIATLLAVPQNPTARYPSAGNASRLRAARDDIASRLLAVGALPVPEGQTAAEVLQQVVAAPVPTGLRPMPRGLPHAARWMHAQGAGTDVTSTLDRGTQALVQRELDARAEEARVQGIQHASVVVVDWASGEIRGLAGSFDFWADTHGAQIAAFDVPRSPGSTLKPFVYASAIEAGRALPGFLVPDVPVVYGTYQPENYDGAYDGLVQMEDALSRSLNIPFVELVGDLGVERFLGLLRGLGVESLAPSPGHYGLSVVVGGVELTPLEVAGLYAALARDGSARALRWRVASEASDARGVMAPGAAWLTRKALGLRDRPDFPQRRDLSRMPLGIHWKTGTSFGHRDAWAVGSGSQHTVVVWQGNLDNQSSKHLVGSQASGPMLFNILEGLGDGRHPRVDPPTEDLKEVEVCALSGRLAHDHCPHRRQALALTTQVPTARCPYHEQIEVDVETGLQVGPLCRDGRDTRREVVVAWPGSVRRWLAEAHLSLPGAPAWAPGCAPARSRPPRIVSPDAGAVALLIPGVDPTQQEIPLEADARDAAGTLQWFMDGRHIGSSRADERLWWTPEPGSHELLVQDEAGRSHRVRFSVRGG